jgi:hypothetical protein
MNNLSSGFEPLFRLNIKHIYNITYCSRSYLFGGPAGI